jgi:hypothetical protein
MKLQGDTVRLCERRFEMGVLVVAVDGGELKSIWRWYANLGEGGINRGRDCLALLAHRTNFLALVAKTRHIKL